MGYTINNEENIPVSMRVPGDRVATRLIQLAVLNEETLNPLIWIQRFFFAAFFAWLFLIIGILVYNVGFRRNLNVS